MGGDCGGLHCPGCGDSGGGLAIAAVIVAVIVFGGGVVMDIANLVMWLAIAGCIIIPAIIAGITARIIYLRRHPAATRLEIIPRPRVYGTAAPELAVKPVPIQNHVHFHGVDPAAVAEIMRNQ